jgi:hypothetical protein
MSIKLANRLLDNFEENGVIDTAKLFGGIEELEKFIDSNLNKHPELKKIFNEGITGEWTIATGRRGTFHIPFKIIHAIVDDGNLTLIVDIKLNLDRISKGDKLQLETWLMALALDLTGDIYLNRADYEMVKMPKMIYIDSFNGVKPTQQQIHYAENFDVIKDSEGFNLLNKVI